MDEDAPPAYAPSSRDADLEELRGTRKNPKRGGGPM